MSNKEEKIIDILIALINNGNITSANIESAKDLLKIYSMLNEVI